MENKESRYIGLKHGMRRCPYCGRPELVTDQTPTVITFQCGTQKTMNMTQRSDECRRTEP